jgi:hypothetical protein
MALAIVALHHENFTWTFVIKSTHRRKTPVKSVEIVPEGRAQGIFKLAIIRLLDIRSCL